MFIFMGRMSARVVLTPTPQGHFYWQGHPFTNFTKINWHQGTENLQFFGGYNNPISMPQLKLVVSLLVSKLGRDQ